MHFFPTRYPHADVPEYIVELESSNTFSRFSLNPEGHYGGSEQMPDFFTQTLGLSNYVDIIFVRGLYLFKNNNYSKQLTGGFAKGGKIVMNLDFIDETDVNFAYIVFHEIGHAVGLPHRYNDVGELNFNNDFPDNVMAGEVDNYDVNGEVYRLRNMWITDYKQSVVNGVPKYYFQPIQFEGAPGSWLAPYRLLPYQLFP